MEIHSVVEVKEAERLSKLQRLGFAHLLRFDESKVTSPRDLMLLRSFRAAAADRSDAFDKMLREPDINRMFNEAAIYIERVP